MSVHPYLHFRGDCAEALGFYAALFGGTGLQMTRYAEAPDAPPDFAGSGRVMHAQLTLGDGTLMASDFPPGMEGAPQSTVSVMKPAPDAETARRWFAGLLEGGAELQPMQETFFSPAFGMVTDRFGTHWIIAAAA